MLICETSSWIAEEIACLHFASVALMLNSDMEETFCLQSNISRSESEGRDCDSSSKFAPKNVSNIQHLLLSLEE
ncbi:hypothetical protein [Anaplasma phagocytophilum]|uniref:hypothetical protein n=1 Tax=Anaplasma phagocytophilum TaxID=948 RepID=UPI0018AD594F|nr:hypothetical protein [Anaplasma phagocytophilum]